MSIILSADALLVEQFQIHLRAEGYSLSVQRSYPTLARHFLGYCSSRALAIEDVRPRHLTDFLREQYQLFSIRHRMLPPFDRWRWRYTGALHMLLRLVNGRWPIADLPTSAVEAFHRDIVQDYDAWMRDLRGLRPQTCIRRTTLALRFLEFLGPRATWKSLARLSTRDIDAYLKECCSGRRRASIEGYTVCLRDFLRHLHRSGLVAADLSGTVIGPRIYDHEGIPSALCVEEVRSVLEVTRQDRSPIGLRDYAILTLLATYGLRATEIVSLCLDDVGWTRDVLRVHHSKTGTYSELPLLQEPGEALVRYLEKARPPSRYREMFLRIHAPHRPFKTGSTLNCITRARLREAGITPKGRKGPHAFRHARAVSLLHSGVPLKTIGDVLGHTSAAATAEYLKLATEDLRAIGLELPGEVSP